MKTSNPRWSYDRCYRSIEFATANSQLRSKASDFMFSLRLFLPSEGRKRFFVMKLRPHFGNLIPGSLKKYAGTVIPGTENLFHL